MVYSKWLKVKYSGSIPLKKKISEREGNQKEREKDNEREGYRKQNETTKERK